MYRGIIPKWHYFFDFQVGELLEFSQTHYRIGRKTKAITTINNME